MESLTLLYSCCFCQSSHLMASGVEELSMRLYPLYYCFSVISIDNQITSTSPAIWIVPEEEILSPGDKWMTEAVK